MMTDPEFATFVSDLRSVIERSDGAEWTRSTSIVGDEVLDSLEILEIVVHLEDLVGREFPEELLETIETLGQLADWYDVAKGQVDDGRR